MTTPRGARHDDMQAWMRMIEERLGGLLTSIGSTVANREEAFHPIALTYMQASTTGFGNMFGLQGRFHVVGTVLDVDLHVMNPTGLTSEVRLVYNGEVVGAAQAVATGNHVVNFVDVFIPTGAAATNEVLVQARVASGTGSSNVRVIRAVGEPYLVTEEVDPG